MKSDPQHLRRAARSQKERPIDLPGQEVTRLANPTVTLEHLKWLPPIEDQLGMTVGNDPLRRGRLAIMFQNPEGADERPQPRTRLDFAILNRRRGAFLRLFGTLPIRGSLERISSQARIADSSKSGASARRICQSVIGLSNTPIERIFGNSRNRLSWCSMVVASQTPLSRGAPLLSRRINTIFAPT